MAEANAQLQPGQIFHVYNHAVGKENLFERDADYIYFLEKLKKYLLSVSDLVSYCLLPNHFHLVVQFKEPETIKNFFRHRIKSKYGIEELIQRDNDFLNKQLSQVYSNFFNTYAKHFNFVKSRTGTLFKKTFRRKEVDSLDYLRTLICYIHQNPVASEFTENITSWKYSSYNAIVGSGATLLKREFVIELFDDLENFKYCHLKNVDLKFDRND